MKEHLLENILDFDRSRDLPLHAQVRRALAKLAQDHFEPGERFFSEPILIEHLRVSQGTIRRALADLVAEGLLDRRPAKGTYVGVKKAGPKGKLGIFVPSYDSPFTAMYLEKIAYLGRKKGRRTEVFHLRREEDGTHALDTLDWGPDEGTMILINNEPILTWQLAETLHERRYRVVTIDSVIPGYEGWSVGMDNHAAVEIGLTHLRQLGHRRVAFLVSEPVYYPEVQERINAFKKIAPEKGFEHFPVFDCETQISESGFDSAYSRIQEIAWDRERVTAVFSVSDIAAWAMLRWAAENGIRVPQDLSVLGFDNQTPSAMVYPPLTTVEYPIAEAAAKAIEMSLAEEMTSTKQTLFKPGLVIRASTGAPSQNPWWHRR